MSARRSPPAPNGSASPCRRPSSKRPRSEGPQKNGGLMEGWRERLKKELRSSDFKELNIELRPGTVPRHCRWLRIMIAALMTLAPSPPFSLVDSPTEASPEKLKSPMRATAYARERVSCKSLGPAVFPVFLIFAPLQPHPYSSSTLPPRIPRPHPVPSQNAPGAHLQGGRGRCAHQLASSRHRPQASRPAIPVEHIARRGTIQSVQSMHRPRPC